MSPKCSSSESSDGSTSAPLSGRHFAALVAIVLLGLAARLCFLASGGIVIDSDEAIVGIMARHILAGRPIPIFYYGQHYMGSLEPLLAAGSFAMFGTTSFTLKLVPLLFSVVLICLVFELAKRFVGVPKALLAALLTAIPPSPLLVWSVMARGGFVELLVIGTAALIVAVDIVQSSGELLDRLKPRRLVPERFAVLGLLLGLGWWVNNQIIFYLAPIGAVIGIHTLRRVGVARACYLATATMIAFFIGGAPFWYYNLLGRPRLRSFGLFAPAEIAKVPEYVHGFFSQALPMMLGARRFWSESDLFPYASLICLGLGLVVAVHLIVIWWRRKFAADLGLLVAFVVFLPLIFCLSSFGFLSLAPRYLLPLYSVLFVIILLVPDGFLKQSIASSASTGSSGGVAPRRGIAAGGLAACFLTINVISNYGYGGSMPGQPFVFMGDRVPTDNTALYRWLGHEGYRFIRANYWIGYRVAFESGESIKFSHFRGQGVRRIPDYERAIPTDESEIAYVLSPKEGAAIARAFSLLGYTFRTTSLQGYQIIDRVSRGEEDSETIPPGGISASVRSDWISALTDGELGTRWGSGQPQNPSMQLRFEFPERTPLSGLDIDYGFWGSDFPREMLVVGTLADGSSCELLDTRGEAGLKYYLEGEQVLKLRFPPQAFSSITLMQVGSDPVFDWSVAEVSFKRPRSR